MSELDDRAEPEEGDGEMDEATEAVPGAGEPLDPFAALGGEGGFDLGSMLQMAQDVTARVGESQSQLAATEVEGSAGGGLVKVTLNGHLHLVGLSIEPAAVDPDDLSLLEDLVLAAWSDAHDQVAELQAAADPLGGLGGGLGGLGGLLGGA